MPPCWSLTLKSGGKTHQEQMFAKRRRNLLEEVQILYREWWKKLRMCNAKTWELSIFRACAHLCNRPIRPFSGGYKYTSWKLLSSYVYQSDLFCLLSHLLVSPSQMCICLYDRPTPPSRCTWSNRDTIAPLQQTDQTTASNTGLEDWPKRKMHIQVFWTFRSSSWLEFHASTSLNKMVGRSMI